MVVVAKGVKHAVGLVKGIARRRKAIGKNRSHPQNLSAGLPKGIDGLQGGLTGRYKVFDDHYSGIMRQFALD